MAFPLTKRRLLWVYWGLLTGLFSIVSASCSASAFLQSSGKVHLTLGNPSNAGIDPNNYLLIKPQYALSYNRDRATANWASWQLNEDWLGETERQDDFRADPAVPLDWYRVDGNDYQGSGYDRGHLVPSGDRTATKADNSATFLMTNIIPQTPENNREPWRELEDYCRRLVYQGKELYIIAGVYEQRETIAEGQVTAPRRTWKIVVVLDEPGAGIKAISDQTRIIAVDIPNHVRVSDDWRTYQVSVDTLETVTGYNFLSAVSIRTQAAIEHKVHLF